MVLEHTICSNVHSVTCLASLETSSLLSANSSKVAPGCDRTDVSDLCWGQYSVPSSNRIFGLHSQGI